MKRLLSLAVIFALSLPVSATQITLTGTGGSTANPIIGTPSTLGKVSSPTGSFSTLALVTGKNIVAGNMVVCAASYGGAVTGNISGFSDTVNTYIRFSPPGGDITNSNGAMSGEIWAAYNVSNVTLAIITVTLTTAETDVQFVCGQVGGLITAPIDKSPAGLATGSGQTSITLATGTLSQSNEIVFGTVSENGGSPSPTGSYINVDKAGPSPGLGNYTTLDYLIVASTASTNFGNSWVGNARPIALLGTFKGF